MGKSTISLENHHVCLANCITALNSASVERPEVQALLRSKQVGSTQRKNGSTERSRWNLERGLSMKEMTFPAGECLGFSWMFYDFLYSLYITHTYIYIYITYHIYIYIYIYMYIIYHIFYIYIYTPYITSLSLYIYIYILTGILNGKQLLVEFTGAPNNRIPIPILLP